MGDSSLRPLKACKVHIPYRDSEYKGIEPLFLSGIWSLRFSLRDFKIPDGIDRPDSRRAKSASRSPLRYKVAQSVRNLSIVVPFWGEANQ